MPRLDPRFSKAWALWLFAFVILEGLALVRRTPGDTLSEHVWSFLDGGFARFILLGGFLAWLAIHFLGRGRWG